jgi:peptidoglycan/LPS O-acetylase OafA/YrhL
MDETERIVTAEAVPEAAPVAIEHSPGLHEGTLAVTSPEEQRSLGEEAGRLLESGDEAGTPPGDRKFRPDVEGLRAVAILLVVLFHAGVPWLTGGFVGVDVFFVISGFVITGLLLREHASSGGNRLIAFYGRRSRRIIPAATLVILVTVFAAYHWLGFLTGNDTARAGRAASLFYSNFYFIHTGTNYLASQAPPSALQNFWSLSVEEQFYVVYPTIFILISLFWRRFDIRYRLMVGLICGIGASLAWSIHQTSTNEIAAFFSPFCRAWELALGALVAVASPYLARVPTAIAMTMSWLGLMGIAAAALLYNSATTYPGSAALLPVVGTALVVAGGTAHPQLGSESLLARTPFQWMGKLSYSLYLWHWPILIVAAQYAGHPLSVGDNLLWLLGALGLSVVSFFLVENPIRHARWLRRSGARSVLLGGVLIVFTVSLLSFEIASHA